MFDKIHCLCLQCDILKHKPNSQQCRRWTSVGSATGDVTKKLNFSFRYIDDMIVFNNGQIDNSLLSMLATKETSTTASSVSYLHA